MTNYGINNGSDYFHITWRVWKLLGAVDLNEWKYGSYQFWRAAVLNLMVTILYPLTLLMVMFSFELPLDNLMNFNISITSVATVVKFLMYTRQLNKIKEIEKVFAELDRRVESPKELEMHKSMTKEFRLISKMFILAYTAACLNAECSFIFHDTRSLPFPAWFPLDWKNSLSNYLMALMYQFLSITAQVLQNFVDDLFPRWCFVLYLGIVRCLSIDSLS